MSILQLRLQRAARIALPAIGAVLLGAAQPIQAQVVAVEEVAPKPVTFTGHGKETTSEFPLISGLTVVSFAHEGRGTFTVSLRRASGVTVSTIYSGKDEVDGSTAFHLSTSEDYELVVRARSDWTITVSQPRRESGHYAEFWGTGPQATPLFELNRGSHAFRLVHEGKRAFSARLLDSSGFLVQSLIQAVGRYDGITQILLDDAGDYLIVVEAEPDTEWSILRQY